MEKIISIEEDATFDDKDGFIVTTDKRQFKVGIYNSQCCCENWGYVITNDKSVDYIGADLLEVKLVDEALNVDDLPEMYEGSCMFVNFITSVGVFQLTCYNDHNGYYGHEAVAISTDGWLCHEEYL